MDKRAMWNEMIGVIKQDVTPATGCTEPIALAYAAATAARELGEPVRFVDGWVSANLMKNGMGVTVPGTGMPGLYIAAAVGALGGDAQVSMKHAGFVVNTGHASARDVLNVIHEVQKRVEKAHGVHLEPEVRIIGED